MYLPSVIPNSATLSVNTMNVYRNNSDTPIQFAGREADCRLFYTREMAIDVTEVWRTVADIAWSGQGQGIDFSRCIGGEGSGGFTGESEDANGAIRWKSSGSAVLIAWFAAVVVLSL